MYDIFISIFHYYYQNIIIMFIQTMKMKCNKYYLYLYKSYV